MPIATTRTDPEGTVPSEIRRREAKATRNLNKTKEATKPKWKRTSREQAGRGLLEGRGGGGRALKKGESAREVDGDVLRSAKSEEEEA